MIDSRRLPLFAVIASLLTVPALATDPVLTIDVSQVKGQMSPTFYGLMTEEINHSYDGGLYAELIRNRAFKDDAKVPVHWSLQDSGGSASMALDPGQPVPDTALTTSLKLIANGASETNPVGVANEGYWGIPSQPKTSYQVSFYAKSDGTASGPLTVSLQSNDGAKTFAQAQVSGITGEWAKYTATLTTDDSAPTSAANHFVISTKTPGTYWFDLVSLFPPTYKNRANGNRIDLMEKLAAMNPAFLRLPGGNYLEGDTIETRFKWKETIGDLAKRPGHPSCWRYPSSDGLGLLEFLEWCEDLKIQPVLAVYAGYSLKGTYVKPGPDLDPYVQEALEEIEYVTGDVSTTWGKARAADGHPEPFLLTYVEIGNEDWFDKSGSYDGRFAQIYDAIKAKYPNLQLIATTKVKSRTPDLIDEHRYTSPYNFEKDVAHFDRYDRNGPKIFMGEWASNETMPGVGKGQGNGTPDMNSALGDAAWLSSMESNSDLVVLESYAPLFVNVNGWQWKPDLIGYDAVSSYGSPSYYVQAMFAQNHGDQILTPSLEGAPMQPGQGKDPVSPGIPALFTSATRDSKTGTIYLRMVNVLGVPQAVQVHLDGVGQVGVEGQATTLSSADPKAGNLIGEPTKVVPVTTKAEGLGKDFSYTFPGYSVTVLTIPGG